MPTRHLSVARSAPPELVTGVTRLQHGLGVPNKLDPAAVEEAQRLVAHPPSFAGHVDRTDIEFVAIDPAETTDVDQILHIARQDAGFVVSYAIADLGAWVPPGGAIDAEAHRRGQTYYAPTGRSPLHPPQLSEGAASLLADGSTRPAMLWELTLDEAGNLTQTKLTRALVRNSRQYSYVEVDSMLSRDEAPETLILLREVGRMRQAIEAERGGVSLNLPEQEVVVDNGAWRLDFRELTPVENWNAQISLLTGIAAAQIMLEAKIGIVRTLPPVTLEDLDRLRRVAKTLRVSWPADWDYPRFVRSLEPSQPNHLAMITASMSLFRGAGYAAFDGELPDENVTHSALATPYAHVTAPLRRLVDRYGLEVCHALANGLDVPDWARSALPDLPAEMRSAEQRVKKFERAIIDLMEAVCLRHQVGSKFEGIVIQLNGDSGVGVVQLAEPAVAAKVSGLRPDQLGKAVVVRLTKADLKKGQVEFKAL